MTLTGTSARTALQLYALTPRGPAPLPVDPRAANLHDVMECVPDGVYSALRTFGTARFLALDEHLARTERSMAGLGWTKPLDHHRLCGALDEVARAYTHGDARFRFDVLAKPVLLGGETSDMFLGVAPHTETPPELMERGVRVDFAPHLTRRTPLIKTTDFVRARKPLPLGTPERFEHLLVDFAGRILECSSSNILFVRGKHLVCAGDGVLEGITQKTVLRLAPAAGLTVEFARVHPSEVASCDECFLTSSFRGPVPIVKVEDTLVGSGKVGPYTRALAAAYYAHAQHAALPARAVL